MRNPKDKNKGKEKHRKRQNNKRRSKFRNFKCKICFQPTLCHHNYCSQHY